MGLSNAIMGYFLAKSYGCFGLCAAIFIAYNIRNVGLEIIFKEQLHLHLGRFFKDVFFKMGIPLILAGIIGYGCHFIPLSGWIGFITCSAILKIVFVPMPLNCCSVRICSEDSAILYYLLRYSYQKVYRFLYLFLKSSMNSTSSSFARVLL